MERELENRKYYSGKMLFTDETSGGERKKRVRMIMGWLCSVCSYCLYHIVTWKQVEVLLRNEYDRKAGKHSSGRDESGDIESGWGTSRVGGRAL